MQIVKIEEVTFQFSDAKFTIKELLSGDLAEIKDKTMQLRLDLESRNQTVETSMELGVALRIRKSLTGWENVKGEDGKKLNCDSSGKKTFCENLPEDVFSEFSKKFSEEYKKMVEAIAKQREKTVKNS